jgi:hypothetical protein
MNKLTEQGIISPFIGKPVNQEHFNNIGYRNGGNNYLICNADYINKPQYLEMFGITDRLKWMWEYSGVDFTVFLTIENGTITECHLYKCKEGFGGHGRSVSQVLSVTQQELRVARRILQYITN